MPRTRKKGRRMDDKEEPMVRLVRMIVELMERHGLRVYDTEYVEELILRTVERDEKECSH